MVSMVVMVITVELVIMVAMVIIVTKVVIVKMVMVVTIRQACSPLIQLFFGFASDIDQTNISRDIRDGNWLSSRDSMSLLCLQLS